MLQDYIVINSFVRPNCDFLLTLLYMNVTPLPQLAALNGFEELVTVLLESGANPLSKNEVGKTNLSQSCPVENECSQYVAQYGKTALDFAKSFQ